MNEKKTVILVVDCETKMQKMLSLFLAVENFKIIETTSGKQGIRLCLSTKPDIVLLDLNLKDVDGIEVITAIREWS